MASAYWAGGECELQELQVGWFVDPTPGVHSEFEATRTLRASGSLPACGSLIASADSAAYGRYDLLTVALHEVGHLLGLEHEAGAGLMADTLPVGTRRLLVADPEPTASTPPAGVEAVFLVETNEPIADSNDVEPVIVVVEPPEPAPDADSTDDSPADEIADATSDVALPPAGDDEDNDPDALFADFDGSLADELLSVAVNATAGR